MKKWIPQFWYSPIKRHRIALISSLLLVVSMSSLLFIDIHSHIYISLILAVVILFSLISILIFYTFGQLKEIWQGIFSFLKTSERNAIYDYYQLKHQDKDYKGPLWEDEEFKKIPDLKERVDAFVKTSIEYQEVDFKRWKKNNVDINLDHSSQTAKRVLSVIVASIISLFILFILCKWLELDSTTISILIKDSRSPVLAALITTVITSPVIFIVWLFRDKNNRVQIENARKDTNLKDFQKLSEWASGFHLPEIKQTTSTKTTNKTAQDVQESTEETTTSEEDFLLPRGSNTINRRQGAEALQASAIAQLETFMLGKYGEQFMQPAFLLIHAIWESIIQQQASYSDEEDFQKFLNKLHHNPIILALNKALVDAEGNHLRLFENSLQGISLIGLNKSINSLKPLNLAGCKLNGIDLSYSNLSNCNFTGTDFLSANLYKINFKKALLQKANLSFSNFDGCFFNFAQLQGANLTYSNVLNDTVWDGAQINRETLFGTLFSSGKMDKIREVVLSRGAIWDDDPNWLIGKIEDKDLLEKTLKDCEKRQKN